MRKYLCVSDYLCVGGPGSWAYSQPNNLGGDQYCGVVDTTGGDLLLGDEPCAKPYRFLCELRKSLSLQN